MSETNQPTKSQGENTSPTADSLFLFRDNCKPWETRFQELVAYKKKNGHANPPQSRFFSEEDRSLGRWLYGQRKIHKNGQLALEKAQRLHDLGCYGFNPDSKERPQPKTPWETRFLELLAYKEKNGHADPRQLKSSSDADRTLAVWLSDQRRAHREGKLVPEKLQKLKDLGCSGFDPDSKKRKGQTVRLPWEARFLELVAYKQKNGHANPTQSVSKLAIWVGTQRQVHRNGKLVPEKLQKLKDLGCSGFHPDSKKKHDQEVKSPWESPWETSFLELVAFKQKNGHASPMQSMFPSEADCKLADWLSRQGQAHREGKLALEKTQKLTNLGCTGFGPKSENQQHQELYVPWETRFMELVAYKDQNGHANPPQSRDASEADYKLAKWLADRRIAHKRGKLVLEKVQKLHDLGCYGFNPDSKEPLRKQTPWETRFLELVAYKQKNGHANPPRSIFSSWADYDLAIWLNTQRQAHRDGKLALEKRQKLTDLGCKGFDPKGGNQHQELSGPWETHFMELVAYKDQNGHANPPRSKQSSVAEKKLLLWLDDQCILFLMGFLALDKAQKLKDLGCYGFGATNQT